MLGVVIVFIAIAAIEVAAVGDVQATLQRATIEGSQQRFTVVDIAEIASYFFQTVDHINWLASETVYADGFFATLR
jgi:hypothetical protein